MDEKRALMLDLESQRAHKKPSKIVRFLKSDAFLITSLVTSILLLCFVLSSSSSVDKLPSSLKLKTGKTSSVSIPVTNENTIDKSKIDPDQELLKDLMKEKAKKQQQQAQQMTTEIVDADFDVNEEYRTIVALSPVIIISWDDDLTNIPVTQSQGIAAPVPSAEPNNMKAESDFEISKNFRNLLTSNYQILPQPAILSINKHPNRVALINHIMKKVETLGISKKSNFLPGLIINGRPVASAKAIEGLHANGKLLDYLNSWGDGVINVEKL